jgi:class 3 adenylate cyclase
MCCSRCALALDEQAQEIAIAVARIGAPTGSAISAESSSITRHTATPSMNVIARLETANNQSAPASVLAQSTPRK